MKFVQLRSGPAPALGVCIAGAFPGLVDVLSPVLLAGGQPFLSVVRDVHQRDNETLLGRALQTSAGVRPQVRGCLPDCSHVFVGVYFECL